MKKTSKSLTATLAVTGMLLAACGSDSDEAADGENVNESGDLIIDDQLIADAELYEAAKEEGPVVLYTGASEVSEREAADFYTEQTGLEVEIIRLAPNKLHERVLSEASADQLGADLIRSSGEDLITSYADADIFEPVELSDDITEPLFDNAVHQDGLYYSTYDRIYSFGYNHEAVDDENAPADWADLLSSNWSGNSGIVQVGAGGSTAALTRFHIDVLGEEWLEDYAANDPRIFDSSANLTDALARGEISVGTIPVATAYSATLDGAPITIAVPSEGFVAYPFFLGMSKTSANPAAAEVYMNWLLSKSAQEQATELGDYSVLEGMPNPTIGDVELPPADSDLVYRATVEESLANIESDADIWTEIFGYVG